MKRRIFSIFLCLITLAWMYGIYYLSNETGVETAETSQKIADILAELFIGNATSSQITFIHSSVRTLAHFALFSSFGALGTFTVTSFLVGSKLKTKLCGTFIVSCFVAMYGFYDEWQKQFIDGRHFDKSEACLNIFSGFFGVFMGLVFIFAVAHLLYLMERSRKRIN